MRCLMAISIRAETLVTEWWVEIRGEMDVIPEKMEIAKEVGKTWGLRWTIERDERNRPDVCCIRSSVLKVSLTPAAFLKLRDEVGHQLAESLAKWVSIAVKCNLYELHCYFETPGAEAVL